MDFAIKTKFVDALLACPAMRDRNTRNAIIDQLTVVRGHIPRSETDRTDVAGIVNRSLDYAGGFDQLIEVLRFYEGDSTHMQNVDALRHEQAADTISDVSKSEDNPIGTQHQDSISGKKQNFSSIWLLFVMALFTTVFVWYYSDKLPARSVTPTSIPTQIATPAYTATSRPLPTDESTAVPAPTYTSMPISTFSTPEPTSLDEAQISATGFYKRGNVYYAQGKYDQALSDYDKAIEANPEYVAAYSNRGLIYSIQGKYEQAVSDFDKAIELDPNYRDVYARRGDTYYIQGENEKAISDYDKVIDIDPGYKLTYINRGGIYHAQGEYEKAISDYEKVIELDPSNANLHTRLCELYISMDQPEIALPYCEKAGQ